MPNTLTSIFTSSPATEPVDAAHPNTGAIIAGTQLANGTWQVVHTAVTKTTTPPTIVGRLRNYTTITASIAASGNVVNNVLATPTGASATGTSGTSINVVVSSIANQGGYRLFASDTVGGTYAQIYQGTTASFAHTGLTAGQAKFYKWQYVGNGAYYDDSALSTAFTGATILQDYAILVTGNSTAVGTVAAPGPYWPFEPTLTPELNAALVANGKTGSFTSRAVTAIAGQSFRQNPDGSAGGMIGNFATQVAGRFVAGKRNVIVIQELLNELSQQVNVGEALAGQRTLQALKDFIALVRADNAAWVVVTGTATKRTNAGTPQPAYENQRLVLNDLIKNAFTGGTLDVQAVAQFGYDVRLSNPGPNANGTASTYFLDWVHYNQAADENIVCPSFRDAIMFALFGIAQDAPYTGAATGALLLSGFTALPVRAKSANVSETGTATGIYNVPAAGSYGQWQGAILFDAFMPAAGTSRVGLANPAADALNAIIGLTASTTLTTVDPTYNGLAVSFYQHEDNRVLVREGATGAYIWSGAYLAQGEYLFLTKIGSALTLTKTTDGTTFTTIYTFTGTYSTDMYVGAALELSVGKLYAPQGLGLTVNVATGPAVGPYTGVVTFADNLNQVNTSGIITAPSQAGGTWGAVGRCTNLKIAANTNGRILMDFPTATDAGYAIFGLSDVNVRMNYTDIRFKCGMWVVNYQGVNYFHTIQNGIQVSPTPNTFTNTATVFSIYRNGTAITFEFSTDGGSTWTVSRTFTFATAADLFIISDLNQLGTMKNPRGTGLTLI